MAIRRARRRPSALPLGQLTVRSLRAQTRTWARTPRAHRTKWGTLPKGASPFGVIDLTGNVWQWTDEFQDEHTRAAILRGGGYYRPGGSRWYFPSAYQLNEHGKYLLTAPSKDRAGTLGFPLRKRRPVVQTSRVPRALGGSEKPRTIRFHSTLGSGN